MRKSIAAAGVAASLAVGGLVGAALGVPVLAGAEAPAGDETPSGAVSWVEEALRGLVDDGTITESQADAVETALDDARPAHRRGFGFGFGHGVDLAAVAEALGISDDELDAAHEERLDTHVADGDLTREEADELLADAEERMTALVEGERPVRVDGDHPAPGRAFAGKRHHGPGHLRGGVGRPGTEPPTDAVVPEDIDSQT